jgi:predicted nucleotidyltransferase
MPGVRLVYLFGSHASGKPGPTSDVDIGVLLDRDADAQRVQAQLAHEIGRVLNTGHVDLVLLNRAPIELAYGVIAHGRRLWEQEVATRVEYEAYVLVLCQSWFDG